MGPGAIPYCGPRVRGQGVCPWFGPRGVGLQASAAQPSNVP